jgi:hypothetical protein
MSVRLSYLVAGGLLAVLGLLWVLQGAGVVGGSFMTGQKLWLGIGIVVGVAGLALGYLGLAPRGRRR